MDKCGRFCGRKRAFRLWDGAYFRFLRGEAHCESVGVTACGKNSAPCGEKSVPPSPGAPGKSPDGRNVPKPRFFPRHAMIRRANSEAPLPAGQTASNAPTGSAPCPPGQGSVAQRAAGGRPLLVGLPPSARTTTSLGPKRSAPAPCSWGGRASPWSRRHWLPAGTWSLRALEPWGLWASGPLGLWALGPWGLWALGPWGASRFAPRGQSAPPQH